MTSYSVYSPMGQAYLGITAVNYQLRLIRADFHSQYNSPVVTIPVRYSAATVSGGSAVTPVPLYEGAPSASATCRMGSLSASGTASNLGMVFVPFGQVGQSYDASTVYQFPNGCIVAKGSAIVFNARGNFMDIVVYFEELRLDWSS